MTILCFFFGHDINIVYETVWIPVGRTGMTIDAQRAHQVCKHCTKIIT